MHLPSLEEVLFEVEGKKQIFLKTPEKLEIPQAPLLGDHREWQADQVEKPLIGRVDISSETFFHRQLDSMTALALREEPTHKKYSPGDLKNFCQYTFYF